MNVDFLTNLEYISVRMGVLSKKKVELQNQNSYLIGDVSRYERDMGVVDVARTFYTKAVETLYQNNLGELKKVINLALEYVFYDKVYRIDVQLDDKRGVKTLDFILRDETGNRVLELDVKDGIGAGVRSVLSFVLHVFYLLSKKAYPVIFIDEGYSQISTEYTERFFSFVKALCKEKNFYVVLVTHDERFIPFADRIYRVNDGEVKLNGN